MAAVPPADADAQAEAPVAAPLTTHDDATSAVVRNDEQPLSSAPAAPAPAAHHDWLDYLTLLLSLTSVLLLIYLIYSVLPSISRRINNLAADPEPEPESRSLGSRLRATRSPGLREDSYDDEDEPEDDRPARTYDQG